MQINYERIGRCFWHDDCEKSTQGVMKEVRREPEQTLLECLHCWKHGYYPVGGNGCVITEDVEMVASRT